ncbi:hypothetical protein [Acinetobacter lwoffii]|uniref:hypothetical protein n=1 Tax=Acinetobacter lwoffii TaxID=28090 RepID=UPI003F909345
MESAFTSGLDQMIYIDEVWLSTQPMHMRAGIDTAMDQALRAFGYRIDFNGNATHKIQPTVF